jgi:restriction endonuclease Mrr
MLPLLQLTDDGQQHTYAGAVERLAQEFQLCDDERSQMLKNGQTRLYNRVCWTTFYLRKVGLLQTVGPGRFQLTDRGREVVASRPAAINIAFLERFAEFSEFRKVSSRREVADEESPAIFDTADGTWKQRPGVAERICKALEASIPNEATHREALLFLALAIECADEERGGAWYLRETDRGLRLVTGRVLACEIAPSKIRVSVIGPISEDVREHPRS